ncbi:MAG: CcmD family protein [Saprospiraceae bacterium]|nr:CcmD family protein [Saprospiraceae bacterium]
MRKKLSLTGFLMIITFVKLLAQEGQEDFMNNIGKIYVVIAVIVLIFIGIFALLIQMERRIKKLENQNPNNE